MTSHTDTRTTIIDAFSRQLAVQGYQGISLSGVAQEAGIQKASLYHHFREGKEAIYRAVAIKFISEMNATVVAALEGHNDFRGQLKALVAPVTQHAGQGISFEQRIYDALPQVSETTRNDINALYVSQILDPITAVFTEAVKAETISGDPWFLANAFLHLAKAIEMLPDGDGAQQIVDLYLNGALATR